ncbi:MAG: hypothetical protein WB782_00055 [Thermoplasmata archaeon]
MGNGLCMGFRPNPDGAQLTRLLSNAEANLLESVLAGVDHARFFLSSIAMAYAEATCVFDQVVRSS